MSPCLIEDLQQHQSQKTLRAGTKTGKIRGHPELNQGPLDLQSNALPLSYIPLIFASLYT